MPPLPSTRTATHPPQSPSRCVEATKSKKKRLRRQPKRTQLALQPRFSGGGDPNGAQLASSKSTWRISTLLARIQPLHRSPATANHIRMIQSRYRTEGVVHVRHRVRRRSARRSATSAMTIKLHQPAVEEEALSRRHPSQLTQWRLLPPHSLRAP